VSRGEELGREVNAYELKNISAFSPCLTENTPHVHYKEESANSVRAISKDCTASTCGEGRRAVEVVGKFEVASQYLLGETE
jgi:hypothetical protein